jgi:trans-2,3-dihydro-3-hydroxyanthranilate isomerase
MTLGMTDYAIYDVFTGTALAGNPLAVVFDADYSGEKMQAIAREFNLSETVFVLKPENPAHTARLRIFTPSRELPFAGHPTVGAAVALADRRLGTDVPANGIDLVKMLEEEIGQVRCAVRIGAGQPGFAEFDLPRLSRNLRRGDRGCGYRRRRLDSIRTRSDLRIQDLAVERRRAFRAGARA